MYMKIDTNEMHTLQRWKEIYDSEYSGMVDGYYDFIGFKEDFLIEI